MNLHDALSIAPDIIGELRAYTHPGRTGTQERPTKGFGSRPPLAAGPIDDSDHLYSLLREHAAGVASAIGTKTPTTTSWAPGGNDRGLPANTSPETAYSEARKLSHFIDHQIHHLDDEDYTDAIHHDLINTVETLNAKYPTTGEQEHIQARCLTCKKLTLFKYPARSYKADETYVCATCGRWHTEIEITERRAARERELKAKRKNAA